MKKSFLYIALLSALLMACANGKHDEHAGHNNQKEAKTKYTCSMHPQVVKDAPGTCPICGMNLVPMNTSGTGTDDLMLSDNQLKLANITTQRISLEPVGQTVIVNGILVENEDLTQVVSSRAAGRVEKLFAKETGRVVEKGAPLYALYSETLLTLQKEYLLAKEQFETLGKSEKRYESFSKAAERKLILYGLTEKQIEKLALEKDVQQHIIFLSPSSGIVTEIGAAEGQYIAEGEILFKIENISKLWIEAELYPNETSLAKAGGKVSVRVSGFENKPVEATINFLSPEYRANTQIMVMRAAIENKDQLYKPGMQVQVLFKHSPKKSLAIPVDAVIRDGKGAHVYVQRGMNTFRPQMVKTGLEDFEKVEITEGLEEGDTVAVTGAYLLYSEIILKKGSDPMAGHNH